MALQYDWYLGYEYLGKGGMPESRFGLPKTHYAMFCPKCGEVWARYVLNAEADYFLFSRFCPKHGYGFMLPFDEGWTKVAPAAVLKRETLLIAALPTPQHYEIYLIFNRPKEVTAYAEGKSFQRSA